MVKLTDLRSSEEIAAEELSDPVVRAEYERLALANDVAIQVLRYRVDNGLSQTELARRLGIPQPAVARLEAGDHEPKVSTLQRLAGGLGVDFSVDIKPHKPPQLHDAADIRHWADRHVAESGVRSAKARNKSRPRRAS